MSAIPLASGVPLLSNESYNTKSWALIATKFAILVSHRLRALCIVLLRDVYRLLIEFAALVFAGRRPICSTIDPSTGLCITEMYFYCCLSNFFSRLANLREDFGLWSSPPVEKRARRFLGFVNTEHPYKQKTTNPLNTQLRSRSFGGSLFDLWIAAVVSTLTAVCVDAILRSHIFSRIYSSRSPSLFPDGSSPLLSRNWFAKERAIFPFQNVSSAWRLDAKRYYGPQIKKNISREYMPIKPLACKEVEYTVYLIFAIPSPKEDLCW